MRFTLSRYVAKYRPPDDLRIGSPKALIGAGGKPPGKPVWQDPQPPLPRRPDLVLGSPSVLIGAAGKPPGQTILSDPQSRIFRDPTSGGQGASQALIGAGGFPPGGTVLSDARGRSGGIYYAGGINSPPALLALAVLPAGGTVLSDPPRPRPVVQPDTPLGSPPSLMATQNIAPSLYTDTEVFFSPGIVGQPFPFGIAAWPAAPRPPPQPAFVLGSPSALLTAPPFVPVDWSLPLRRWQARDDQIETLSLPAVAPSQDIAPPLYTDTDSFFSPGVVGQPFPFSPIVWPDPPRPRQTRDLLVSFSLPAASPSQALAPSLYSDTDAFFAPNVTGQPFPFYSVDWPPWRRGPLSPELIVTQSLPLNTTPGNFSPGLVVDSDAFFSPLVSGQPFPFGAAVWSDPQPPLPRRPDLVLGSPGALIGSSGFPPGDQSGFEVLPRRFVAQDAAFQPLLQGPLQPLPPGGLSGFDAPPRRRAQPEDLRGSPSALLASTAPFIPAIWPDPPRRFVAQDALFQRLLQGPLQPLPPGGQSGLENPSRLARAQSEVFLGSSAALLTSGLPSGSQIGFGNAPRVTRPQSDFYLGSPMLVEPQSLTLSLYVDTDAFFALTVVGGLFPLPRAPYFTPSMRRRTFGDLTRGSPLPLLAPRGFSLPFIVDDDSFYPLSLTGQPFPFGVAAWPNPAPPRQVRDFTPVAPLALIAPTGSIAPALYVDADAFFAPTFDQNFLPRAPIFTQIGLRPQTRDLVSGSRLPILTGGQSFSTALYDDSVTDAFFPLALAGGTAVVYLRPPYFTPIYRRLFEPGAIQGSPATLLRPFDQNFASYLTADDGTTILTADDGVTPLTVPWMPLVNDQPGLSFGDVDVFFSPTLTGSAAPLPVGDTVLSDPPPRRRVGVDDRQGTPRALLTAGPFKPIVWPDIPGRRVRTPDFVYQNLLLTTLARPFAPNALTFDAPPRRRIAVPDTALGSPAVLVRLNIIVDLPTQIESRQPLLSVDIPAQVEFLTTHQPAPTGPIEWQGTQFATPGVTDEFSPSQSIDIAVPAENIVAQRARDGFVPIEVLDQVAALPNVQAEETAAQQQNQTVPVEWLASSNTVIASPAALLEWLSSMRVHGDSTGSIEFVAAVLWDVASAASEFLSRVSDDQVSPLETGSGLQSDATGLIESLASGISDLIDIGVPLEFSSAFTQSGAPLTTEFLSRTFSDYVAQLEAGGTLRSELSALFEWLGQNTTAANSVVPIESSSGLRAESLAELESIIREIIEQVMLLEFDGVHAVAALSASVLVEWLATAAPVAPILSVSMRPVRLLANEPRRAFGPITAGDVDNFAFDFTFDVGDAELVSTSWSCSLERSDSASDPTPWLRVLSTSVQRKIAPRDLLAGHLGIRDGFFSVASIGNMPESATGGTYRIEATATLSNGEVLTQSSTVFCKPALGQLN